ncbi:MAG: glycosyltransferase family 4 protein [Deltaproteobacteria bacterium]|nr:glycosyltransferase family 4 protein [Deltaproteobacteria bacterium]
MALIAVDLTPVVPGGDNGGAKPLAMELLKGFQSMAKGDRFLILTASWNHDELAVLDAPAMKRLCVIHRKRRTESLVRKEGLAKVLMRHLMLFSKRFQQNFFQSHSLRDRGVDLLFCPFTAPTFAEPGIPVVSVIHDFQYQEFPHFFTPDEYFHRNAFMQDVARKADAVICVSEYTRQAAVQSLSIPLERSFVIPNCVQLRLKRLDSEEKTALLERLGIAAQPYLFYPANFWPHKNHRMLLTAYGIYLSRHPEPPLHLVLTGALTGGQQALKDCVGRMGLTPYVHFPGYISENELSAVWEGCSCLIFPSLFEGFGIPVLEAMNFNKPVLCSNASSLPEVAGNAALYFDPRKPEDMLRSMETLFSDSRLQSDLIKKGRKRLQSFRSEDMVAQYLASFHLTLQNNPLYKNEISGVFGDLWTGREFSVAFASGNAGRFIEMVIELPPWTPHLQTMLEMKRGSRTQLKWKIIRGEEIIVRIPLPEQGGFLSFGVKQTFCPAKASMGEDHRHLGVRCKRCVLSDQDQIVIWPT